MCARGTVLKTEPWKLAHKIHSYHCANYVNILICAVRLLGSYRMFIAFCIGQLARSMIVSIAFLVTVFLSVDTYQNEIVCTTVFLVQPNIVHKELEVESCGAIVFSSLLC